MTLILSELYTSIQGEGPNVGQPTQFVRFAGCNLRCPGWPCDTEHAINPSIWRREAERLKPEQLVDKLALWPRALTLTGGEPFMQDIEELEEFFWETLSRGYTTDVFTNGTFEFPEWAIAHCTIIFDWKLGGSGESHRNNTIRNNNLERLDRRHAVKFTVKDINDLEEARYYYETWQGKSHFPLPFQIFFVGGVWGQIADVEIIEFVEKHQLPWRLNVQLHKHIWKAEERGV